MLKQRIITAVVLAPLSNCRNFLFAITNTFWRLLLSVMAIGAWEWGPLMGFAKKSSSYCFCHATSSVALISRALVFTAIEKRLWLAKVNSSKMLDLYRLWLAVAWWLLYPQC